MQSMGRPENVSRGPESKLSSIAEALQLLGENLNAEGRCLKTLYDACNDVSTPLDVVYYDVYSPIIVNDHSLLVCSHCGF